MEFTIYFADRKMNILGNASTKSTASVQIQFDEEEDSVEVASAVYELTLDYSKEVDIDQLVDVGFYAIFVNEDGEGRFYTIIDLEKDVLNRTVDLYMEDGGLDLINDEVGKYQAAEAHTIDFYINKFTYDSGFEIGVNEIGNNLSRKLEWEDDSTVTKRLESIATQFDHAELNFSFEIKGMTIAKKYINIYKKRGKDVGTRLKMGKDIHNIVVSRSITNLATALNCEGGTPKGQDKPITLKGYKYDDGRFYVDGTYLKDRESLKVWSRYISPDEFGTDEGHLVKRYSYDTTSQSELCNRAVSELTKASQVEQNFEVDITVLPKHCRVGDTVYIVDNDEKLYLQARILKLTRSRSQNEYKAVLGDYLIKESGISDKVLDLIDKIDKIEKEPGKDGENGLSCYLTKETMSVPANKDGNIDSSYYQYMKGNFVIIEGNKEVDPEKIKYEVLNADGCSGNISVLTGEYVITRFYRTSSDAKLNMRATYKGVDFNKTFTVTKSKEGQIGPPGKPGEDGKDGSAGQVVEVQSSHIGRYSPDRPVKGMVWFQTGLRDGRETVIAIKDYTGSGWVERQINHEPIHIDKLSALTADIGVITAGAISTPDIYIGITRGQIKIFDTSHDMEAVIENGQLIFKESTGNKKQLTLDKYGIRNEDYYFGKRELNFVPEGLEIRAGTSNTGDRKNSGLELIGDKAYLDFHTGFGTSRLNETDWDARVIAQNRNRGNREGGALLRSFSYGFDLCVEDDVKIRTLGDAGWRIIRALEFKPNSELKHKNILEKYNNGLEDLRKIDFYEYSRDDGNGRYLGLITDYVKDKLPIIADEEGVSLYSLVSLVGQGLKELDKKTGSYMTFNSMVNDEQNEKIKELERKNNELEERLSKLEALYG